MFEERVEVYRKIIIPSLVQSAKTLREAWWHLKMSLYCCLCCVVVPAKDFYRWSVQRLPMRTYMIPESNARLTVCGPSREASDSPKAARGPQYRAADS